MIRAPLFHDITHRKMNLKHRSDLGPYWKWFRASRYPWPIATVARSDDPGRLLQTGSAPSGCPPDWWIERRL